MRGIAVQALLVFVLGVATAHGQPPREARARAGREDTTLAASVEALSDRLGPSEKIFVQTTGGENIVGRFARASETALTLNTGGRLRDVPARDVQQVQRQGGRRIGRGAWIGFLVGAGGGLLAAAASGGASDWSFGERATVGVLGLGGMGAEIGAVTGIFIRERPVVYQKDATVPVVVVPVLAPGQVGVTASVPF